MPDFENLFHNLRAENTVLRAELRKYKDGSTVRHYMREAEIQKKKVESLKKKNDSLNEKIEVCKNRCAEQTSSVQSRLGDGYKICSEKKTGCIVPSLIKILEMTLKENEKLRKDIEIKDNLILEGKQKAEITESELKRIPILQEQIKKLEAQVSKDSTNSSKPSSTDAPWNKKHISNSRTKSGKKPGAQPGHEGHHIKQIEIPDSDVIHKFVETPDDLLKNPNLHKTGKQIHKMVYDIRVKIVATDYYADEYIDKKTGKRTHAPFPDNLINEINYGSGIKAFAWLLVNMCNVSISKTTEFFKELSGGKLDFSEGFVSSLAKQFSDNTKEERDEIFRTLQNAEKMHTDTTYGNVNGDSRYINVFSDKECILYLAKQCKGLEAVIGTPLENFYGVLIHDHDKTYYHFGKYHQECLAHILRYLNGAQELEKHLTWHMKMHSFLQNTIHLYKENDEILSSEQIDSLTKEYESILQIAEKEYQDNPPSKFLRDGINLFNRLKSYKEETLFFLSHPGIDYTNNFSESELRRFKRKQKTVGAFRSDNGLANYLAGLTIIENARLQKKNIFVKVKSVFESSK